MRVAVLGIGTMGAGIARSLLRAGIEVTAWNRTAQKARELSADGASVADTLQDAVRDADVVLTVLFDEQAVRVSAERFLPAMKDDAIWMQAATVGPDGMRRLAALAAEHSRLVVDAPVLGTRQPAEDGTLVVLVSGAQAPVDALAPVFDAIGSKTVPVGSRPGAASALKLSCNAWIATITAAAGQSIAMCAELGLDPSLFLRAIAGSPSDNGYLQTKGAMMLAGDFTPSFPVEGALKDVGLMIDAVGEQAPSARLLGQLHAAYLDATVSGHAEDDMAAVATSFGFALRPIADDDRSE